MRAFLAAIAVVCLSLPVGAHSASATDVRYYDVGAGDHPHDVAPAPDGTVWYTAQHKGLSAGSTPKRARSRAFRWVKVRARMA